MIDWYVITDQYLKAMHLAWSPTTLKSERARLNVVIKHMNLDVKQLWKWVCMKYKPYSRVTTWTRLTRMVDWAIEEGLYSGTNEYKKFRQRTQREFKHVYERHPAKVTYRQAQDLIRGIEDEDCRTAATDLLRSGMRSHELFALKDGCVRGKGNKPRKIFGEVAKRSSSTKVSYGKLYQALRKVGLKPHELRKTFLSEAVRKGANHFELCKLAGWSSINTASSYIGVEDTRLEQLVGRINE